MDPARAGPVSVVKNNRNRLERDISSPVTPSAAEIIILERTSVGRRRKSRHHYRNILAANSRSARRVVSLRGKPRIISREESIGDFASESAPVLVPRRRLRVIAKTDKREEEKEFARVRPNVRHHVR